MSVTASPSEPFIPPTVKPPVNFWQQLLALPHALSNQIELWPASAYEAPWWRPSPIAPVFIMDPDLIGEVFLKQAETFNHGALLRRMVKPIWGGGIFATDGPEWRWQRQTAAPAFRPDKLGALVPTFAAKTQEMIERWNAHILGRAGRRFDLVDEFSNLTREVVLDTILGGGDSFRTPETHTLVKTIVTELSQQRLSFIMMPDAWHQGCPGLFGDSVDRLRAQVREMVKARRSAPPRGDLVSLMMSATDPETGQAMDDDLLTDNLMGFIAAGRGHRHRPDLVGLSARRARPHPRPHPRGSGACGRRRADRRGAHRRAEIHPPGHPGSHAALPDRGPDPRGDGDRAVRRADHCKEGRTGADPAAHPAPAQKLWDQPDV